MLPIEKNYDEFLETVIENLKKNVVFHHFIGGFYIVYGSYVIGEETPNSDIDIIYIYTENRTNPFRRQFHYHTIPITVYFVSKKDFFEDSKGKYGGFFVGKALNPHIILNGDCLETNFVYKCIGDYIVNLAANIVICDKKNCNTIEQITKQVLRGYLKICPSYIAYLIRYDISPKSNIIWSWMVENVKKSLLASENIKRVYSNKYKFLKILTQEEYDIMVVDYIANFWSFGAIAHNDMYFYNYYKEKNYCFITNNNYQSIAKKIVANLNRR